MICRGLDFLADYVVYTSSSVRSVDTTFFLPLSQERFSPSSYIFPIMSNKSYEINTRWKQGQQRRRKSWGEPQRKSLLCRRGQTSMTVGGHQNKFLFHTSFFSLPRKRLTNQTAAEIMVPWNIWAISSLFFLPASIRCIHLNRRRDIFPLQGSYERN